VGGAHLAEPLPTWLSDAHETYLIGQACPGWTPEPDEMSDFKLRVMARIHDIHKRHDLEQLGKIMGGD